MFVKLTISAYPNATISSNNSNTTIIVRIPLVDSTVQNNQCHLSFDSNLRHESNNITTSSSRQYYAGILIFWSTRTVIRKRYLLPKRDRWPAAEWKHCGAVVTGGVWGMGGYGCEQIIRIFLATFELMHWSIIISIRTLSLNAKACLLLQIPLAVVAVVRVVAELRRPEGPPSGAP